MGTASGPSGYVGQSSAYLTALKYASAGLVALLLYLYPVFVALLAVLVLREPLTGVKGLALGLALVGTALTVGPMEGQILGILLAQSELRRAQPVGASESRPGAQP